MWGRVHLGEQVELVREVFAVSSFSGCEINFARKSKIYRKNPKKPKTAKNTKKPVPGGFSGPDPAGRYEVDFSSARWGPPQKPPSFIQKTGPRTCGIVAGLVIVKEY